MAQMTMTMGMKATEKLRSSSQKGCGNGAIHAIHEAAEGFLPKRIFESFVKFRHGVEIV